MRTEFLHSSLALFFFFLLNSGHAQFTGCTDALANNYNPLATENDGSCTYTNAAVTPEASFELGAELDETSGLIHWNNNLWTHNDNSDINLYALDPSNGNIVETYAMTGITNIDWEEITQDETHVYLGDFGNNANGNRTDLTIYRILKSTLQSTNPSIETIQFNYVDQDDLSPAGANNTNYDCEAFIVSGDSIYLFTKEWVSNNSRIYALPKSPGNHTATLRDTLNVQGLITGSVYLEEMNIVALTGYTNLLQPFVYLLYDFSGTNFYSGNKRRLNLQLPFHQVEAIASDDGLTYYITNEFFQQGQFITVPQKMHMINLSPYLMNHVSTLRVAPGIMAQNDIRIFPNPAVNEVNVVVHENLVGAIYGLYDLSGNQIVNGRLTSDTTTINMEGLPSGTYFFLPGLYAGEMMKIIKQ